MKERIENLLTLEDILSNKKYSVIYYQRGYRWGRKQIEQLIDDLTISFDDSFDKVKAVELADVERFDYYMGTIIVTGSQDIVSNWKLGSSLSLVMFKFAARPYDPRLIQHKYGHAVQSLILGPIGY